MNELCQDSAKYAPAGPAPSHVTAISPVDLRQLEPVACCTPEDIVAAVSASRAAQQHWRMTSLDDRICALKKAAKRMLARRSEVIDLARTEMGKVDIEGLFNEALGPLDAVTGWAPVVRRATESHPVRLNPLSFPKKSATVEFIPRGVTGIIAPWNFPSAGLYRSTIPALMTGNGIVIKPSEYTPRTTGWLAAQLAAELPGGLVQVVQGGAHTGRALIDAGIDACVFTGSACSGEHVRVQCARRAIPCSVEMGGKDGAIVMADCDLARTVAGITHWTLSNAGQSCGAIEVAYVEETIADEFVRRLGEAFGKLRTGPGDFAALDVGPLANLRQFETVCKQVADAVARGAKVVCGGAPRGDGYWFAPTILDNCDDSMSVVTDETFGPVLAVVRVQTPMEGVRRVNQSRYGLGASIWTKDLDRARKLASQLDTGVVTINNHSFSGAIPSLPWSGTRATGFSVANGPLSLPMFVRPRVVIVDRSASPEAYWMPYDRGLWEMGDILADAQIGRVARVWRMPLILRQRVETVRKFFK